MLPALPSVFASVDKTKFLNTIAVWLLVGITAFWVFFKEDPNKLNQQTVDKLVMAVDKFSKVSETITETAMKQREWASKLEHQLAVNNQLLERGYGNLYERYGYDKDSSSALDDLYARQLFIVSNGDSSGELRGDENGAGKAGNVQRAAELPKGNTH